VLHETVLSIELKFLLSLIVVNIFSVVLIHMVCLPLYLCFLDWDLSFLLRLVLKYILYLLDRVDLLLEQGLALVEILTGDEGSFEVGGVAHHSLVFLVVNESLGCDHHLGLVEGGFVDHEVAVIATHPGGDILVGGISLLLLQNKGGVLTLLQERGVAVGLSECVRGYVLALVVVEVEHGALLVQFLEVVVQSFLASQ
jgi:hypothetical protein